MESLDFSLGLRELRNSTGRKEHTTETEDFDLMKPLVSNCKTYFLFVCGSFSVQFPDLSYKSRFAAQMQV